MQGKERRLVPELRFGEFAEDWRAFRLSELLKVTGEKSNGTEEVFSVSVDKGLVNQIEHLGRSYSAADTSHYKAVRPHEIVYTRSPTGDFPYGIIKQSQISQRVIVSPLYGVYRPENNTIGHLIDQYFSLPNNAEKYLLPIIHKGAKNTININNKTFLSRRLALPCSLPEQRKIASFITAVDGRLAGLRRQRAALERYKRGVLQGVFSGESRFRDKNGENYSSWKTMKFGEAFKRVKRKNKENNQNILTISAQQGLVNQEDYFNKSVSSKDVTGYYLIKRGEFAYNKSYSKGYPFGAIKRLNIYDKGVLSPLYICFAVSGSDILPEFMEQYFGGGGLNHEISKIAQEGARNHGLLNVSVVEFFKDIKITVPSLPEQRRIATFLRALDERLALVERQLAGAEAFKRGLLQQMFV